MRCKRACRPRPFCTAQLDRTRNAIADLVRDTSLRAGLRDRTLRLNAELAAPSAALPRCRRPARCHPCRTAGGLALQRIAAALLGAGRAENLIGVGEFQREYTRLTPALLPQGLTLARRTYPA
jgi:hypothetical protein